MRRARFVRLISEYLDGEISPRDKASLFEEVRCNPESRDLFASFTKLDSAVSRARFPVCECACSATASHWTGIFSWCAGGAAIGALAVLVFMAMSEKPPAVLPQIAAVQESHTQKDDYVNLGSDMLFVTSEPRYHSVPFDAPVREAAIPFEESFTVPFPQVSVQAVRPSYYDIEDSFSRRHDRSILSVREEPSKFQIDVKMYSRGGSPIQTSPDYFNTLER
ncbi:MAG: hypothetical protein JW942_00250 [Opitutales bacterium]|nr:hypothetical protein [Opitutales bacterium]